MTGPRARTAPAHTSGEQEAASLRTVVLRLAQALRAPATSHGLTPSRLAGMVVLAQHAPIRVGDFARRLRVTPASASRLVDVLAESGMVQRLVDPRDQRASLLALTDAGERALADVRRIGIETLTDQIDALAPDRRQVLLAAVPVLEELAEAMAGEVEAVQEEVTAP